MPDGGRRRAARRSLNTRAAPACASSARPASAAASTRPPRSSAATRSTSATPEKIAAAIAAGRVEPEPPPYIDLAAYRAQGGYRTLAACVRGERAVDAVIAALEESGLRGLGGAGFPAGRKWKIVRAEPAPRLMAVNIDEGEPGTFKDRYYLERDPHRFLEGVLIAAWAVGHRRRLHLSARRVRGVPRGARARDRGARGRSAVPRCRRSICAAAPAPTSAAKSRR